VRETGENYPFLSQYRETGLLLKKGSAGKKGGVAEEEKKGKVSLVHKKKAPFCPRDALQKWGEKERDNRRQGKEERASDPQDPRRLRGERGPALRRAEGERRVGRGERGKELV